MKKMVFAGLMYLIGFSALAQTPTQTKGFFGQAQTRYEITLDQPTIAGQAIILDVYAAGAIWQPGTLCTSSNLAIQICNFNLYDSQGNQFVQVNRDYPSLLYVPASKGGIETITISYALAAPENLGFVAMVFPYTLVLQDVVPPRCDFRPQSNQNQICNPWNSGLSVLGSDATTVISSYPLISSVPNELFIGHGQFGLNGTVFTALDGWATPVQASDPFISYKVSGPVGTEETFTVSASPALPEGHYAYLGIEGFKVIPIQ
jgi:hypothetical protein